MAQTNYTPISLYYSTTASNVPTAANLVPGELAINTNDGKLYYEDSSGVVQTLASKAGALGDVVGPASATDNALARFDLTTGKLIQNSVGILSDAGVLTGLTGLTSSGSITLSSLTSGRVTYAGASGLLTDSANLTYNGTGLGIGGTSATAKLQINVANVSTLGSPASSGLSIDSNDNNIVAGNISQISLGLRNSYQPSYISYVVTSAAGYSNGDLTFGTRSVTTDTAPTERIRITSAGVLDIGTGAGAVGQIQFPATAVPSANANTLDDYEEGTWTPTLASYGSSISVGAYSLRYAAYKKIGNLVHVDIHFRTSTITGGTLANGVYVTGLPFPTTTAANYAATGNVWGQNYGVSFPTAIDVRDNVTNIDLMINSATVGYTSITVADLNTGANKNETCISFTYQTD